MGCGKIQIYKQKDWADDFAFVFIRQMYWQKKQNGYQESWYTDSSCAEAFLLPMEILGQGDKWSRGEFIDSFTADVYPGLADCLKGLVGADAYGAPPLDLKPGIKSPYNPSQWQPTVPYTLAELWVWTDQGWCFQASRRNW